MNLLNKKSTQERATQKRLETTMRINNLLIAFFLFVLPLLTFSAGEMFPSGPNQQLTPGKLCTKPENHRYPENIPYCGRHVDSSTKALIIKNYDEKLGYQIQTMDRKDFKIDHFFPLCAGGGNDIENLWPQHKSVFAVTDALEALVCLKMSEGKLLQKDAIAIIIEAKNDLSKVDGITKRLNGL